MSGNKYGTIERLNDAWAENYENFESVVMPTKQDYDMRYYDYIQFNDDQFIQWYTFMKSIIREYTDKPVHVKNMHNIGEHDHQGVDRRYKTAFGMNPERFAEFCEMNGNDAILIPNWVVSGGQGALEKSLYYDYLTSLRDAPVNNSEDHIVFDQDSTYNDFYADFTETDLWQGAVHGRTISTIWTWERAPDSTSVFNGLYLYRPDCVAAVGKTNLDLNRYAYEVKSVRDEKRDVAILYSISSRVYQTEYMNAVYKAYEATTFNGKHPLILNEENIAKLGSCDALIIPHAVHVKESAAKTIYNFIQNGGKVMIIGNDSLTYTEETNTRIDQEIRDYIIANSTVIPCKEDGNFMSSPTSEEFADAVENFLVDNKLQYIRLIDTATGKTVSNMEWLHGIKDGKIILNISNYEVDTPKTVNIEIGGRIVERVKDIRNGVVLSKDITVEPYSPMLFEIETDNVFVDTYKHWGEEEITALYKKGYVSGVSDSRFAPDKNISRVEFLALCIRTLNVPETTYKNSFEDVSVEKWYSGVVEAAKNIGLTEELASNGMLNPETPITREEMMSVLVKTYEHSGKIAQGEYSEQFDDAESIGEKFAEYVKKAVSMGWVKGDDGKLLPNDLSTRAEASALLNRYLESK